MYRFVLHSVFLFIGFIALHAEAVGLGKLAIFSALGQPLRAEIELVDVQREELGTVSARLASAEAFRQARIERAEILNALRFEVERRHDGQPVIRITSTSPIAEPFLDLLIELNWSAGRLIREYTLLLDPPAEAKSKEDAPPVAAALVKQPAKEDALPKESAESDRAGRYGPVRRGETLNAIANKTRPADASTEQMMLAIYAQNPSAFLGGNMNRLKRGVTLVIPEREEVLLIDPMVAIREVQLQVKAWKSSRARLAEAASQAASLSHDAAGGRIQPKSENRTLTPAKPVEDVLKLSRGEPQVGKALARIQSLEEELAAKARALKEAQERIDQLERTIKDLQRLLRLKAEEQAARREEVAPPPPAPVAPSATAKEPTPGLTPPSPDLRGAESAWWAILFDNPLYLVGLTAAGLLTLVLAGMSWHKHRQRKTQPSKTLGVSGRTRDSAQTRADAKASGAPTEGTALMTDFSRLGMGTIDAHEVDPIAEAEVYIAYGRDAQAEEILKEALNKDPNRHEIALKLLEIYAARRDRLAYEAQARALYARVGAGSEIWQKVAEMGRSIDPDNPLYRMAVVEASSAAPAAAAAVAVAGLAAKEADAYAQAQDAPVATSPVIDTLPYTEEEPSSQLLVEPEAEVTAETVPEEKVAEQPLVAPAVSTEGGIEPPAELAMLQAETPAPAPPVDRPLENDIAVIEASTLEPLSAQTGATSSSPAALNLVDEEKEGAELTTAEAKPAEPIVAEEGPAPTVESTEATAMLEEDENSLAPWDLDLSAIDLELSEPAERNGARGELDETQSAASEKAAEDEAESVRTEEAPTEIDPEIWEENNTKLDLARAYIEMGDLEGAREILQEVLNDGDSQQRDTAKKLLSEVA